MDANAVEERMKQYYGQGFDVNQLQEIKQGLQDDLDVTRYARTDMPASAMSYQRKLMNVELSEKTPEPDFVNKKEVMEEDQEKDTVLVLASVAEVLGEISILIAGIAIILIKLF